MRRIATALLVLSAAILSLPAQAITVEPGDSNAPWLGFMNVFELPVNGQGFVFGSPWGTADLVATFDDGANTVDLTPNTIGDPDPFWYIGGGAPGNPGNKFMEANLYIEETGPLAGQMIDFSFNVLSDTTTAAHNGFAFIRDFAPDYSSSVDQIVALTGGPQTISLTTINDPARHVQYGFRFEGENVWAGDEGPFGGIQIQTIPVAPPAPFGPYNQNFDGLTQADPAALSDDGWLVYGEVYEGAAFQYVTASGDPAPNVNGAGAAYSNIATGEGAGGVGDQYLNAFSDYECCTDVGNGPEGHNNPLDVVRSVLYQEYEINSSDVGRELEFAFDIKLPDSADALTSASTAEVFMRNVDGAGIDVNVGQDVLSIPGLNATTWTPFSLNFTITADMVGEIFQFGIESSSSSFNPTGVYLDNISMDDASLALEGDYNGDGFVSQGDLDFVLLNWGDNVVPPGFDEAAIPGGGPFDGQISQNELDGVLLNWGNGTPPSAATSAVPEPSTVLILALGGCLALTGRRRA